ncbi:chromosomal replication initiator protein DnaA [Candidatus Synchoanobacter obligatus]|uniref:Chromosomal replication initiator protein DnaA n=1 Tax=Candidatus Synchoanobacter obligatus TaxID=2919597 RepID=A0ABT1L4Y6_9GAMM|nr:chromosomal replication initiator protein DnaA [Candidatus Synchoanobacter obligatus]MCP8352240.1 chromosomal replication initiator protein DnaA [Candidatus Synchoanobacter obligatus]
MVCEQLWGFSQTYFQSVLGEDEYETHIRPIQSRVTDEGCLELVFPNRYMKHSFTTKYIGMLKEEVLANQPQFQSLSLRLVLEEDAESPEIEEPVVPAAETEASSLNPNFVFESLVVGRGNELGHAAARQVSENPGVVYNPLVIYGDVGLGKTHLMQAIGHYIQQEDPQQRVCYVHSEQFVSEMIRALQKNTMEAFKNQYRNCVLLLDDIQFFVKKIRSQEELFHTMNSLLDAGQQIIATSDRFPKELEGLESRLKSRFSWGLTVGIDPPELETRVAILLSKAKMSGVRLPEDVAFFIADRIQSNVRELEGALKRLIANASFLGQPITLEFTKQALRDMIDVEERSVNVDSVLKAIAHYYKLSISEITGTSRKRTVARPRQLAMYLAKTCSDLSLSQIGRLFGGRDHTTIMHGCKKIVQLLKEDPVLKSDYENLLRILLNH